MLRVSSVSSKLENVNQNEFWGEGEARTCQK